MRFNVIVSAVCLGGMLSLPVMAADVPVAGKDQGCSMKMEQQCAPGADLKLSEDQKVQLKKMRDEMKAVHEQSFEKIKDLRQKIKDELLKPVPGRSALTTLSQQLEQINTTLAEQRIDHLLKVKALLSEEQFKKMLGHEFWGDKMGERGEGPGMRGGKEGCAIMKKEGGCPMMKPEVKCCKK